MSLIASVESHRLTMDCSLNGRPIVTAIVQAGKWYNAEDYHQEYRACRAR